VNGATQTIEQLSAHNQELGVLMTPRGGHRMEWTLSTGLRWGADNSAFDARNFKPERFVDMLWKVRHAPRGLFICAPDVRPRADLTLRRFYDWLPALRQAEQPIALVAQDGLERETIPWSQFQALFVGATDAWKFGPHGIGIIREAKRRGLWVHIGRVNWYTRMRWCQNVGADSVDGSGWSKEPSRIRRATPVLQTRQLALPGMTA
jgi:hypothetical protein